MHFLRIHDPVDVFSNITDRPCGELVLLDNDVASGSCDIAVVRTYTLFDDLNNNQALDAGEESETCVQNFLIVRPNLQIPSAPPNVTVQCADDVPSPVMLTATGCQDITVSPTDAVTPGSCPNRFSIVRTWTFNDGCDNGTVSQTITVNDVSAPVAPASPADLNLECAGDVPLPVDLTAMDNCDGPITISPDITVIPGSCPNDFTEVRTWTFTDICGNSSDVASPANVTVQCTSDVPVPVDLTASDNCDGDITVSPSDVITPGSCPNRFTMVRTWTFVDGCGNESSISQTINVNDDTAPIPPASPANVTVQCASDVPVPVDLTASDNCDGDITVSPSDVITPGSCPNRFNMVRTWTFMDLCGNSSDVSQTITVNDDTAPVPPAPPADVTVQCIADVPAPVDLTAVDNCDGNITVSPTPDVTPGDCDDEFIMVRTWTFTDVCGEFKRRQPDHHGTT